MTFTKDSFPEFFRYFQNNFKTLIFRQICKYFNGTDGEIKAAKSEMCFKSKGLNFFSKLIMRTSTVFPIIQHPRCLFSLRHLKEGRAYFKVIYYSLSNFRHYILRYSVYSDLVTMMQRLLKRDVYLDPVLSRGNSVIVYFTVHVKHILQSVWFELLQLQSCFNFLFL